MSAKATNQIKNSKLTVREHLGKAASVAHATICLMQSAKRSGIKSSHSFVRRRPPNIGSIINFTRLNMLHVEFVVKPLRQENFFDPLSVNHAENRNPLMRTMMTTHNRYL